MLTQETFVFRIFRYVTKIFVFFEAEMIKETDKEIKDLEKYVRENHDKVCDWGYSCSHVPYREQCAAMRIDTLKEISRISRLQDRDLLSQHLWRLIDGWERESQIELFLKRKGIKAVVSYTREDFVTEEMILKEKLEKLERR